MKPLRIALTKGRLERDTVELFEEMGLDCSALREKGRKLILPVGNGEIEAVLAKAADVITYVEHGVCDLGVVGKDTILENGTGFYEILDLGFGKCRFALAGPKTGTFLAAIPPRPLRPNIPMSLETTWKKRGWTSESSRSRALWNWPPCLACLTLLSILWKQAPP